jgi:hypothetical protein
LGLGAGDGADSKTAAKKRIGAGVSGPIRAVNAAAW